MKQYPILREVELNDMINQYMNCVTDIICDNLPEDNKCEMSAIMDGISALGSKDISNITRLFKEGVTIMLVDFDVDEDIWDGLIIHDGDKFIGIVNKSDANW